MQFDPQVRALLNAMAQFPPLDFTTITPLAYRAALAAHPAFAPGDAVAQERELSVAGAAGPLPARLYRPHGDGPWPLTVFFHGGGFVTCGIETHHNICRSLANRAGTLVLSVGYRLAPEARFPAAADDACAALRWSAVHAADLGALPDKLAVAGDSAGGNLAAVACQQLRDSVAVRHQLLLYPYLDCADESGSWRTFAQGCFLTEDMLRWYARHYLPEPPDPRHGADVRASPLRQRELAGVAPATIITAEFDPLRDQGEAYGAALQRAGVDSVVRRWPGQIHGFMSMQGLLGAADAALDLAAGALRAAFADVADIADIADVADVTDTGKPA
ncbi:alpha/beta hydrolase [Cupriavidus basilensis]|uniref:Acetyl esterase n=1 Tax=Cupriavidus basilensis TaxID=68895 RepID=A0A0C4YPF9_9BURK|nr:alpha/beta hydrolase [Cupriavidus basilensis]AJG23934.1 Acetyl esterase [Cupriavidus basilensis]